MTDRGKILIVPEKIFFAIEAPEQECDKVQGFVVVEKFFSPKSDVFAYYFAFDKANCTKE